MEVRRCTVQGEAGAEGYRRIVSGDVGLGRQRRIREGALGLLRDTLGPSRYASWRKTALDLLSRAPVKAGIE